MSAITSEARGKAIGYCRFSSDNQETGDSISRQRDVIERYCKRNQLDLGTIYVDEALSAFSGDHIKSGEMGAHPGAG